MLAIGAGFALPRTGRTNPDSVCSSSLALAGARIVARARAQAARLCPAPCPARGEDRNSETQGRGRGGRGGGAADAPRGEPGGCRAAACDGSLVCAARGPPRAPHGAAPALSPILASRFSRRAQWRPFPSSRKQQYADFHEHVPLIFFFACRRHAPLPAAGDQDPTRALQPAASRWGALAAAVTGAR